MFLNTNTEQREPDHGWDFVFRRGSFNEMLLVKLLKPTNFKWKQVNFTWCQRAWYAEPKVEEITIVDIGCGNAWYA
jgi:hypothetical protein